MKVDWRAISGPALAAATAAIAMIVDRSFFAVPNPARLFVCIVAFAGSLSGLASGLTSAAIAVAASALFFLNRHAYGYEIPDLVRLALLAVAGGGGPGNTPPFRGKKVGALSWGGRAFFPPGRGSGGHARGGGWIARRRPPTP